MTFRGSAAVTGLLAAVLGAALALRQVGSLLNDLAGRAAAFSPGPIPHVIDWIGQTEGARRHLQQWNGLLGMVVWLAGAALVWRLLRLMNPGGTLLAPGASAGEGIVGRLLVPLNRRLVRRGFVAALATAWLCGGIGALIRGESPNPPPLPTWGLSLLVLLVPGLPVLGLAAAFVLGGALLWFLWGHWSALTPAERRSRTPREIGLAGAVAGAGALPVFLPLTPWGRATLRQMLDAVGLADYAFWITCFRVLGIGLPIAFFLLGCVAHALASGEGRWAWRSPAVVGAAGLLALATAEGAFYRVVAQGRLDVGRSPAGIVHAATPSPAGRAFLILAPAPRPIPGFVAGSDVRRLDASAEGMRRTWEFLRRRRFQSAAAEEAFVRLHDAAALAWDSNQMLRVNLANLEHNPQPVFGRLLVEKLTTCAPTAENRARLQQAADAARFHQSPYWMRVLGLLHHRFGDREKAVWCLGWAGLSEAEIVRAIGRGTPLTDGEVRGRVRLNDRPAAGVSVGLLPADRWRALVGRVRPFEMRWVAASAVTDAGGEFRLGSLGEGSYLMIVMDEARRLPVLRATLRATGSPGVIRLDRTNPRRELGTIQIDIAAPSGAPSESPDAQSA
jgi:hypothetical protein